MEIPWIGSKSFSVVLLTFVNLINYMDRFTVVGILDDVKSYYNLTDTEQGLLQTVFIVSYMLMAPVFGYLGDRYTRKIIMAGGIAFWSLTTYLGSIIPPSAPGLFFLMRGLVGTGEASYSTIAPTIISDLYIGPTRTKMLAVFFFAIPVGSGLGYIAGSQLAHAFSDWRYALRLTPLLGIISAVVMLFSMKEPPRGEADGAKQKVDGNFKEDLIYISKIKTYLWTTVGFTCVCFTTGSLAWWGPPYIIKVTNASNMSKSGSEKQINLIFGAITGLAGIAGVVIGSLGANHYRKISNKADALLCSIATFLSAPFVLISISCASISPALTWITIGIGITLLCVNWTLVTDMLLSIVVPHRRSIAQAIQILVAHLLGDAFSPYIVGAISDSIKSAHSSITSAKSLEYALYINCIVLVLGGFSFLYASISIEKDQEVAKAEIQNENSNTNSSSNIEACQSSPRSTRLTKFSTDECFIADNDRSRLII